MDIHKPRAWHGWREFLKEYAIIVVGVLTALAGEQLVETLHWRDQSETAVEAMRDEVSRNLVHAAERLMVRDCIAGRLTVLAAKLNRPGPWTADPLSSFASNIRFRQTLPEVYHSPHRLWGNGAWQAALASGALAHVSDEQLKAYGLYYRQVEQLREFQAREENLSSDLQPLAYDQLLGPEQRITFQMRLAGLDTANGAIVLISAQFIEMARRNGLAIDKADLEQRFRYLSGRWGACVQSLGSTADALPPATK